MSYQVLARKYRPSNFNTLIGQNHISKSLINALDKKRLHHAYLFTGTRGVGKTTISRILAKCLNCIGIDGNGGITSQPCGKCSVCVKIDNGCFMDYIEMDAASTRGINEMAQLLEQTIYAPINARYKIYVIDEVHMLTHHAFNAMLKTLEEPPKYIKFILATTEPQKIPITVLSRCIQFNLKKMLHHDIVNNLCYILNKENIKFETSALNLIATGAQGSMRDALSLTDQAINYSSEKITLNSMQEMLSIIDQKYLIQILDALAEQDGNLILSIANKIEIYNLSYSIVLKDLSLLLHQISLIQISPEILIKDSPNYNEIIQLSKKFNIEQIQLFYQISIHGRNELELAPDEYAGFTMTLLRMLVFQTLHNHLDYNNLKNSKDTVNESLLSVSNKFKNFS
ncbi:DNA polymerase III subunit gamma/tau [Candidatus Profftella armatura]|uniref:DNA polymerase III subunit gamma/tau n=1 Tax=Candidatus Profftella armatura TaxID=669502 RepID=S5R457_9PROT|nr:DNA polymerase III subunit gamma/tau [Candidatus Profftella armatura]AGS06999.1 DNA polymerase III subunits gamma and tau [Candidatus Profftella armatura]QLK13895.1 DNA polymerase III subunit gamma/tau [Candidatus Profftella armatura]